MSKNGNSTTSNKEVEFKGLLNPFGPREKVSLFTLGTMRAIDSENQMYEIVKAAVKAGINHFETAPSYGASESFLGKAIEKLNHKLHLL